LLSFADCHLNFFDRTFALCVVAIAGKINVDLFGRTPDVHVCHLHDISCKKKTARVRKYLI